MNTLGGNRSKILVEEHAHLAMRLKSYLRQVEVWDERVLSQGNRRGLSVAAWSVRSQFKALGEELARAVEVVAAADRKRAAFKPGVPVKLRPDIHEKWLGQIRTSGSALRKEDLATLTVVNTNVDSVMVETRTGIRIGPMLLANVELRRVRGRRAG